MRVVRVLAVLAMAAALAVGGYVVGLKRGESQRQAKCGEVVERRDTILNNAAPLLEGVAGGPDRDDQLFRVIEEVAILTEQNPRCFSPTDRAMVETHYRGWQRGR